MKKSWNIVYTWKYVVVVALIMLSVDECHAQDETRPYHWRGYMQVGLNTDGWEAHFGVAWMSTPYTGVAASIGFAGEVRPFYAWGADYFMLGARTIMIRMTRTNTVLVLFSNLR